MGSLPILSSAAYSEARTSSRKDSVRTSSLVYHLRRTERGPNQSLGNCYVLVPSGAVLQPLLNKKTCVHSNAEDSPSQIYSDAEVCGARGLNLYRVRSIPFTGSENSQPQEYWDQTLDPK